MRVNLLDIYAKAFGYVGKPWATANLNSYIPFGSLFDKQEVPSFQVKQATLLGTALFMPCKLDGFQLPNEPIIEVSGGKRVIKTVIDGSDGTFKEQHSMDDYSVIIRGIAVSQDSDEYPEKDVRKIRQLCEKKGNVTAVCQLLTFFGIDKLVIESFSFPAIEGAPGMQPYELTCISDKEFDIELKKGVAI